MKRAVCGITTLLVLAAVLGAQAQTDKQPMPAAGGYMSARYEDLKWQPIIPELGKDSPEISILRVDPKTQATQLLIRCPKAIRVRMHWHTANETHTLIKGTATFEHDGKRETLGPGSFNYIPAKMHHQAWISAGSVAFITVDGAWDVNWVDGAPGKADVGQRPPPAGSK